MDERAVAPLAQYMAEQTDPDSCAVLLRTHQASGSTEDSRSGNSLDPLAELQNGVWGHCVRGMCWIDDCDCLPRLAKKKMTFLIKKNSFV